MMLMTKQYLQNITKKKLIQILLVVIKPFIVPILIILIFIALVSSITDILYISFSNDDKIDIKKELAYYNTQYEKEKNKQEIKEFFTSVWDFVDKIFGGREMSDETDWPVEKHYTITSEFGYRQAPTSGASTYHSGIDIAAPEGTKLVCIMDGEVVSTGWGGASGYTITIKSIDGKFRFSYCHSSPEYIVSVGQKVKKGEIIGKVGPLHVYGITNNPYKDSNGKPTNGATTGCHCHFMIRKDGELINPLEILKKEEFI